MDMYFFIQCFARFAHRARRVESFGAAAAAVSTLRSSYHSTLSQMTQSMQSTITKCTTARDKKKNDFSFRLHPSPLPNSVAALRNADSLLCIYTKSTLRQIGNATNALDAFDKINRSSPCPSLSLVGDASLGKAS